jgi:hypothetical protein
LQQEQLEIRRAGHYVRRYPPICSHPTILPEIPVKKLRLDLDELKVESFEAEAASADTNGTVRGHGSASENGVCTDTTCNQQFCVDSGMNCYSYDGETSPCVCNITERIYCG